MKEDSIIDNRILHIFNFCIYETLLTFLKSFPTIFLMNISLVINLIKKEVKKYQNPIVTELGEATKSPYIVLISCLLSLRTKDETTAKASVKLFKKANNPKKMIKLNEREIQKLIYPVGFYRVKAKRIRDISKVLLKQYKGKVPDNFDELMKLKGVGRKTANIVMTYGFGSKNHIAVDTHVHRIPNRLGWVKTNKPEETEAALKKLVPKRYWHDLNDNFVTFGQNVCRPVGPKCPKCPVNSYCDYGKKALKK